MDLIKKITLSENFSAGLFYLSLVVFIYAFTSSLPCVSFYEFNTELFVFAVGALGVYPVIESAWSDVKDGWEEEVGGTGKTYRDFFAGEVSERVGEKLVQNHWSSIRWIIPYVFGVYLYLTFFVVNYFQPSKIVLLFFGSLLMISLVSVKYQRQLEIEESE